jgi:hypothetical protein
VFASIDESAIRRVIAHFTRQFNYGSAGVQQRPGLLCRPIDAHPVAVARGNVLITAMIFPRAHQMAPRQLVA